MASTRFLARLIQTMCVALCAFTAMTMPGCSAGGGAAGSPSAGIEDDGIADDATSDDATDDSTSDDGQAGDDGTAPSDESPETVTFASAGGTSELSLSVSEGSTARTLTTFNAGAFASLGQTEDGLFDPQEGHDGGAPPPPPPPPDDGGSAPPPPDDGGSAPPPDDGGSDPPPDDGGAPPPDDGSEPPPDDGIAPPPDDGSAPPPDDGSAPPPDDGSEPPPDDGSEPPPDGDYCPDGNCEDYFIGDFDQEDEAFLGDFYEQCPDCPDLPEDFFLPPPEDCVDCDQFYGEIPEDVFFDDVVEGDSLEFDGFYFHDEVNEFLIDYQDDFEGFIDIPFEEFFVDGGALEGLYPDWEVPPEFTPDVFGEFDFGLLPPPPEGFLEFPPIPGFLEGFAGPDHFEFIDFAELTGEFDLPEGVSPEDLNDFQFADFFNFFDAENPPPGIPVAMFQLAERVEGLHDYVASLDGDFEYDNLPPGILPEDFPTPEEAIEIFAGAFHEKHWLLTKDGVNPDLEQQAFEHQPLPEGFDDFDFHGDCPQFKDLFTDYNEDFIGQTLRGQVQSTFSSDGVTCSETAVIETTQGEATPPVPTGEPGISVVEWDVKVHETRDMKWETPDGETGETQVVNVGIVKVFLYMHEYADADGNLVVDFSEETQYEVLQTEITGDPAPIEAPPLIPDFVVNGQGGETAGDGSDGGEGDTAGDDSVG